MRTVTCLVMIACMFLTATSGEAGGLFRRVPEVGEWAAFDWNSTGDHVNDRGQRYTHERHETLTVKCVGEETIENRRHLWIECHLERPSDEYPATEWFIYKVLVPEDILVNGEPSLDGIRGWFQLGWTPLGETARPIEEPLEFTIPDDEGRAKGLLTFALLGGGEPGDSEPAERTIEVEGQEHVLTRTEGRMPLPYQSERVYSIESSEGTWWLSEDLAFGVAAAEITSSHVNREREDDDVHLEDRFELIATGTGAVSDLPEHN